MKATKISFPVTSIKRLEHPSDREGKKIYEMIANVKRLDKKIYDWRNINPRDPKTNSDVARDIRTTLEEAPEKFLFKNKGLLILADKVEFDNKNSEVILDFVDNKLHGLADGGHTMKIIMDYNESEPNEEAEAEPLALIKIQVIEGVRSIDDVAELVEARNTSTQVQPESIFDLKNYFQPIKQALVNEVRYKDLIAYKEYEEELGKKKPISIRKLISFMTCFDKESFDSYNNPIFAYSSKGKTLRYFEENRERLTKYASRISEINKFWDEVYKAIPSMYLKGDITNLTKGDKKKSIVKSYKGRSKGFPLYFIDETSDYKIPEGYVYPIFAAFRMLIEIDENKDTCRFVEDPIKVFRKIKDKLSQDFTAVLKDYNNDPQEIGKSNSVWTIFAKTVEMSMK